MGCCSKSSSNRVLTGQGAGVGTAGGGRRLGWPTWQGPAGGGQRTPHRESKGTGGLLMSVGAVSAVWSADRKRCEQVVGGWCCFAERDCGAPLSYSRPKMLIPCALREQVLLKPQAVNVIMRWNPNKRVSALLFVAQSLAEKFCGLGNGFGQVFAHTPAEPAGRSGRKKGVQRTPAP